MLMNFKIAPGVPSGSLTYIGMMIISHSITGQGDKPRYRRDDIDEGPLRINLLKTHRSRKMIPSWQICGYVTYSPFRMVYFQGRAVKLPGVNVDEQKA